MIKPVTFKTSEGLTKLTPGAAFKSHDLEALKPLLNRGIISPFCYWLDTMGF